MKSLLIKRVSSFLLATLLACTSLPGSETVDDPSAEDAQAVQLASADDGGYTFPTLVEAGQHLAKIARLVKPTVVHIQSRHRGRGGSTVEETGSGVILSDAGGDLKYVVTNHHVIRDAKLQEIEVHLHDGRVLQPQAKREDLSTDIAVLLIQADDLHAARWGDSDQLDIGHFVLAMGSPFGLSQSMTLGIISAKGRRSLELGTERDVINQDFLQTDAAINPGNSGGPLIDMYGRVVGINTAIASASGGNEGIGFSIPSNLVKRVVTQLLAHGRVYRAYLGVLLDDKFDHVAAQKYALDRIQGARVVRVYPDTPAARAGLRPDDLILSFDGRDIEDENHLIHLVSLTEVSRTVRLIIIRDSHRETLNIQLTDRPGPG